MKYINWSIVIVLLTFSQVYANNDSKHLTFDEFLNKVRNGDIVRVELTNYSSIHGMFKTDTGNVEFTTYQADPNNNPLLLTLLRDNEVTRK